jgi:hypothetical protein
MPTCVLHAAHGNHLIHPITSLIFDLNDPQTLERKSFQCRVNVEPAAADTSNFVFLHKLSICIQIEFKAGRYRFLIPFELVKGPQTLIHKLECRSL